MAALCQMVMATILLSILAPFVDQPFASWGHLHPGLGVLRLQFFHLWIPPFLAGWHGFPPRSVCALPNRNSRVGGRQWLTGDRGNLRADDGSRLRRPLPPPWHASGHEPHNVAQGNPSQIKQVVFNFVDLFLAAPWNTNTLHFRKGAS